MRDIKGDTILKLTQKRFFASGNNFINDATIWKIPVSITTKTSYPNVKSKILFETSTAEYNLGKLDSKEWILLNPETHNLHRTHYEAELFELLKNDISSLSSIDRLMLQNNSFAFAKSGLSLVIDLFKIVEVYENEYNPYVLQNLSQNLLDLSSLLVHTDFFDEYRNMCIKLFKPISQKIGWEVKKSESVLRAICRESVFFLLSVMGDQDTLKVGHNLYLNAKNVPIPETLKKTVYTASLLSNSSIVLKEIFEEYKEDSPDADILIDLMGYVTEQDQIEKALNFALNDVSDDESVTIFTTLASNPCSKISANLTWDFVKKNFKKICENYEEDDQIGELIEGLITHLSSTGSDIDIKAFLKSNKKKLEEAEHNILVGLEKFDIRSKWLARIRKELENFIPSQKSSICSLI